MSQETVTVEKKEEFIPLLKFVRILHEKGINVTVESVGNGMAVGSFKYLRDEKDKWHIAKSELLRRIKASGKKWPPIEEGYLSIYGFLYEMSLHEIDYSEDQLYNQMYFGLIGAHQDTYGRWLIPVHEFEKKLEQFGDKK